MGKGLCGRHWMEDHRLRNPPAANTRKNSWAFQQTQYLIEVLDREPDGLGYANPGELAILSAKIGRTEAAVTSRLHHLRQARRAAQDQACK